MEQKPIDYDTPLTPFSHSILPLSISAPSLSLIQVSCYHQSVPVLCKNA